MRDAHAEPAATLAAPDEEDSTPGRYARFRERLRHRRSVSLVYQALVTIAGFLVVGAGVVMLPLPGPGWLVIFLGLGILSTEYEWSRRLLAYARRQVGRWVDWVQAAPLYIRLLVGLGCAAIVAAALGAYIWWAGMPGWVPGWVPIVHSLPTRG
jgi:uncharacterized protein (TIGR02611 family)